MKRYFLIGLALVVIFALLSVPIIGRPNVVHAAAVSEGCAALNNPSLDALYGYSSNHANFSMGDLIVVSAHNPSTYDPYGIVFYNLTILTEHVPLPATLNYTIPANGTYVIGWATASITGVAEVTWTISCTPAPLIPKKQLFDDGRCNQQADQSVAIYPDGDGGYNFYALYNSVGHFALHLTKADLDANSDKGETYLIAQAVGVQVYRLKGGTLQVRRLKPDGGVYIFNWPPCD